LIERLVSIRDPGDALAVYYARFHPDSRTFTAEDGDDVALFVSATSRYGPIGVLRATSPRCVPEVLAQVPVGRRYVTTTWSLGSALETSFEQVERNRILWTETAPTLARPPEGFELQIDPGEVRARASGQVVSRCSLLWRSPHFAEVMVETSESYRRRGLARAVVEQMIADLLAEGIRPLYVASSDNTASLRVARSLGFQAWPEDEAAGYIRF